jgi:exopolysaccharide production protein ExoQ
MSVLAVMGSFVMVAMFPEYGLSHDLHAGDWKGLFPHKNIMGRQMVFAILALGFMRPAFMPWSIRWASLAGAGFLLFMSHSATAMASVALCAAAYPVLYLLKVKTKKTLPIWVPFIPLVAVAIVVALANADVFLALLGRNSTLTGRTVIWNTAIEGIGRQPWFGHGFSSFWGRSMAHSHNGYLDILLDIGIVGLLLFAGMLTQTLSRALQLFQRGISVDAKWPVMFLLFFVTYNIAESSVFRQRTFLWIPFVSIAVSLAALFREERSEALEPAATAPEFST